MTPRIARTPPDRFEVLPGYDFSPTWFQWEGLRIHYLDEGAGPPVILFHGEPTWSFLWRKVLPPLVASGHRVIASDYPGFGKSDKPTDPDFYTYDMHVDAMRALVAHLDLLDATAVVQDWGGPIGLRTAVEDRARFRRLVILNTGLFAGGQPSDGFMRWRGFVERTPDLPIRRIMQSAAVTEWADDVYAAYEAPFPTPEHKVGAHRFPLIVPIDEADTGAAEIREVLAELATWEDPVLVVFSDSNPIFSLRVGERFAKRIPGAGPLEVVEGAGHFLQEDRGEEVGASIAAFLTRTGLNQSP